MKDDMFVNLGRALTFLRDLRGLSKAAVARGAKIGQSQLIKYELGRELPKLDSLARVLRVLGVGYAEFFQTLHIIDSRAVALDGGDPLAYPAPPNPPGISPSFEEALRELAEGHVSFQKALWQAILAQPWRREALTPP